MTASTGSFRAESRRRAFGHGHPGASMDEAAGGLAHLLGRKWTVPLLLALREEPRGFNALERHLGVTSKPLAERLDALRCRGFVTRTVHPTTPPTTTYRLTDGGHAFADQVAALADGVALTDCPEGGTDRCVVPTAPDADSGERAACCPD